MPLFRVLSIFVVTNLFLSAIVAAQSSNASIQEAQAHIEAESKLNSIIENITLYNPKIRPRIPSNDTGTIVAVNLFIRNIGNIDDINMEYKTQVTIRMEWEDPRLKFDYQNFITLPENMQMLWMPDLFIMNEKTANLHKLMKPNVMIRVTPISGTVLLSIRLSLTLACPQHLAYYPLDRPICEIKMASYSWPKQNLHFQWTENKPVQLPTLNDLQMPRFSLINTSNEVCDHTTATGTYSCLKVSLQFKRELGYYMIQNFLPCCLIVLVSWISFWLGASTIEARVSLGFTTLLTMVAQIYGINQAVPPVSYAKALDVFTGSCLIFIVAAIIEVSIVGYNTQLYKYRQTLPLPFTQNLKNQSGNPPGLGGHLLKRCNKIDKISRFLFPFAFFVFNVAYWYVYMFATR